MAAERRHIVLHSGLVVGGASGVAVLLLLANVCGIISREVFDHDQVYGLVRLFDFNTERNLPSFFSGCLFLVNMALFLLVWRTAPGTLHPRIWLVLAGLFLFLAYDELFSVHEKLNIPLRERFSFSEVFYYGWIVVYGGAVLLLAAVFIPVWWRLQHEVRWWLALSAITYVGGAIGVEMAGAKVHDTIGAAAGLLYSMLYTLEESLEMAGLIMLMHALLLLQTAYGGCAVVIPGGNSSSLQRAEP